MLTGGDEFYAVNDLRCDDLDVLIETLTEGHSYTFSISVLVEEDITVVRSNEFLHCLIRSYDSFLLTQTDLGRYIHTRTQQLTAVRNDDLALEGVTRRIDGRVHDLHGSREDLIGIDFRSEGQFHPLFEFREVVLRNSNQRFETIKLSEHQDRLTSVELAVLVVLSRNNAAERSLVIRVCLNKLQLLFRGVVLRSELIQLLLGSRTGLEQHLHTFLLGL